ncbi:MAG: MFS transporter [Anaerolineae bacterium]|jgi:predicted MFS family arabinose efflux permease
MKQYKRLFITLAIATFFMSFGFNVWRAIFNNFAVEEIGVTATQIGLIQSLREVPGLLGFTLGFLVLWLSEMRVLGLSVLLMGLGIALTGWANNLGLLILGSMVMSFGFHYYYPTNSSVVLMGVGKQDAPKMLGFLRSVSSAAAVTGTAVVAIFVLGLEFGPLSIQGWGYRTTLWVTGAVVIAGSFLVLRNGLGTGKGVQREKRKVVFRREYWLYYTLTFLMGIRRHIFTTFAIFMLVSVYEIPVSWTATLLLVNNLVSIFSSAVFGFLVARFGERKVLTVNFLGLMGVFLGYAFASFLPLLFFLFIVDHVFFGFNVAIESYFQKIALSPDEITSNLGMAQTINHISALVVPVLGGILWEQVSPSAPFIVGVIVAMLSLILVQFMRIEPTPRPAPQPAE